MTTISPITDAPSMVAAHIRADGNDPSNYDLDAVVALAFETDPGTGVLVPVVGPQLFRHIIAASKNVAPDVDTVPVATSGADHNTANTSIPAIAALRPAGRRSARRVLDQVLFNDSNASIDDAGPSAPKTSTPTAFDSIVLGLSA